MAHRQPIGSPAARVAQTPPNAAKFCQMLPNAAKFCQITTNYNQCQPMPTNGTRLVYKLRRNAVNDAAANGH